MQTWVCRECSKICFSKEDLMRHEMEHRVRHAGGGRKCPNCGGSGVIVHAIGPNETCRNCNGSGFIPAW